MLGRTADILSGMSEPASFNIFQIERPNAKLMTYYFIICLFTGPLFPILILPNYFRYHTMRYRFDAEGISMRWGILFRREVVLNYARIQDIHLSSNIIERWLGLARIQIQTASGSSSAEMTIEGILEFEAIRDFLYSKMRGLREAKPAQSLAGATGSPQAGGTVQLSAETAEQLIAGLHDATRELRQLREDLAARSPKPPSAP